MGLRKAAPICFGVFSSRIAHTRLQGDWSSDVCSSDLDGWWDAEALDELCTRVHRANLPALVGGWEIFWLALKGRVFNRQRRSQAAEVAHVHYDLGNDVYQAMLDRRMQYT